MNKLILISLLSISTSVIAVTPTAFTFVAPASVAVAPVVTNLLGVVNAFKAVGTAFALNDPTATALLDQAAQNLTLSIDLKNLNTSSINAPTYNSSTGQITWINNFTSAVSSANSWVQVDSANYDLAAMALRDAGGNFAITAIMTGSSGMNRLLSAIDGTTRVVNGIDYIPDSSFNALANSFNTALTLNEKMTYLTNASSALTSIQAQALALDVAGAVAVTTLNSIVLPAANKSAVSYADLNALLLYNSLQ
ncbi:hypothetical protein [Polynucleobacter kasalickyi]|uniref:Uncharacterized protein n=1 Tax=Polynucleobacter kasalickyi TaxID=1938817 RepID=A0A1W1Y9Y8_9BURK|nr:hypothetical protein [Polynucleobacter kasalickyi]SMC32939.1 hypothetical protein SAMN06296008_102151 [Polynucleobacter kasalickyi]